jgi:hypothetical protein
MDILQSAFIFALVLCALYAGINGGRTDRAGAAIFIVATILSAAAATMNPSWATTSYGLFAVDGGCLLALLILALNSNRYWPIWAMGFQTVAVATHMATLWLPDFLPKSYHTLSALCPKLVACGRAAARICKTTPCTVEVPRARAREG